MTVLDLQKAIEKNKEYERQIQKLESELTTYKDSLSSMMQDFDNSKSYCLQLEGEKSMLQIEVRRLTEQLEAKKRENEELRNKNSQLDNKMYELSALQYRNMELETQIKQQKVELEKKDQVIILKLQDLEVQYQRITQLETQLGSKFMLEDKIKQLNSEIDRITKENQMLKHELEDYRYNYTLYNNINDRYHELLVNYVLLSSVAESQKS